MPARKRSSIHLTDAASMRALAHPTRLRLLGLLRVDGPATAARLGDVVHEAPGTISYHLGKLRDAGMIEETIREGGETDGRERWWRATHDSMQWEDSDHVGHPATLAASAALQRSISRIYADQHDLYVESIPMLPTEWVAAATSTDSNLRLSVTELAELRRELLALGARWEAVSAEHEAGDGSERVVLVQQAYRRP